MIVCQNCGYQNDDDDTFCGGCPAYLPHSGVHVDDDAVAEEPVEVAAAAPAEGGGLISRVKEMVGMDEGRDVPGDVLVEDREADEAAARAQQEADEAAAAAERAAAEAQQRREAERKAREEAAERARAEQQEREEAAAAAAAKAEAERKAREEADAAAAAKAEAERKAREEAEGKAKAEAEERERRAAEEKAEAQRRAQAAREAQARAQAEREARERAEAEAAAAVEAEERERAEAEAKAAREAEERARAEVEAQAKAEQEAAERAAAAAKQREEEERKAADEARKRAEQEAEAKRQAEEAARQRAAEEEKARAEAERRLEEERKAAEAAEREAAEAAERARRAAAMVAKPPPAPPSPPSRRKSSVGATTATVAASAGTATAPASAEAGTATGAGPTALKPTEQRPTAPPPRPPTRKTPPTRKPEPGDQICGQCGEPNKPERKFCRRCANPLADAVVVKRPWWQRIVPRRKPKAVAAGERPGRTAKGTRKQPLGRRIAKIGRMSLRWVLAAMIIIAILGSLGLAGPWSDDIKGRIDGAYSAVMNRIRPSYEPANPVEAVASAQTRGAAARRVIDGFDNTHWASGVPVTDRPTLTLSWAEPVDIARVGFLGGASGDDFRALARPREIRLIFSDGSRSDITLKDTPDFQAVKVSATQARDVRLLVRSVYPAPDTDAVAITEIEFFTRR